MPWRITYTDDEKVKGGALDSRSKVVKSDNLIKSNGKIEFRDDDGQIVRLGKGSDFELRETPLGMRPIYGSGPVFLGRKGGCGKYRTSCYMNNAHAVSVRPDIFIQPGKEKDTDEFYAVIGDITIYEFDEKGRSFIICSLEEGNKAIIGFDSSKKSVRERYSYETVPISDAEYEYITEEFMNPSKWR